MGVSDQSIIIGLFLLAVAFFMAALYYRMEARFQRDMRRAQREITDSLEVQLGLHLSLDESQRGLITAQANLIGSLQHLDSINDQLIELQRLQLEVEGSRADRAEAELAEATAGLEEAGDTIVFLAQELGTCALLGLQLCDDLRFLDTAYQGLCRATS